MVAEEQRIQVHHGWFPIEVKTKGNRIRSVVLEPYQGGSERIERNIVRGLSRVPAASISAAW